MRPESRYHGRRRWAFGLACVALAPCWLMGQIAFAGQPAFAEVTEDAGLSHYGHIGDVFVGPSLIREMMQRNMGNGAAVGDVDDDGDLDVYLLGNIGFPNVLYRNDLDQGSKTFTDITQQVGGAVLAMPEALSRTAQFADLDDDGDLDLIVINDDDGNHVASSILRNDGDGTFADVTAGSGFAAPGYLRCGLALADYDQDGRLDLYVTNWGGEAGSGRPLFPGHNLLFRNLGGFRFEEVTEAAGLGRLARDSFSAIFTDFTGNGYPDLHVAIDHTSDEFYVNNAGTFERVTNAVGAVHTGNDMGVACADFDDDGDLDLYATNITDPDRAFGTTQGNVLYVNQQQEQGLLRFLDEARLRGAEDTYWGWGVEFLDVENDGDLDILAVNGFEEFIAAFNPRSSQLLGTPAVLLVNGSGYFRRALAPGLGYGDDSRALIAFDYDRDGDEDLLITNTAGPTRLLENLSTSGEHWFAVAVIQRAGVNYRGIGVTVRAIVDSVTRRRDLVSGDSYLAGTPAEVHFGLADATSIERLEVEWTDGSVSIYHDVPVDRFVTIYQLPGDWDHDGDVDRLDARALRPCVKQGAPLSRACQVFDFDLDGDLDDTDLRGLAEAFDDPRVRSLQDAAPLAQVAGR